MKRWLPVALPAVATCLLLVSCGDEGSGSSVREDPEAGSESFLTPGGDNSIQRSGEEASPSERNRAAAALRAYLDARAAGAWKEACTHLAPSFAESLVEALGGSGESGCPKALASLSEATPQATRERAADVEAGALRVGGGTSYLLLRGPGGDFFIPMARRSGEWKAAALTPSPLP